MTRAAARAKFARSGVSLPTGRPGSGVYRKGKARLRSILETSEYLISKHGYARFSMRRVAVECGFSLAALQHYFPSLQLLIKALLSFLVDRYRAEIISLPAMVAGDAGKRLEALVDYYLVDLKSEHNRRLFAELWAMALRDRAVAAAMDRLTVRYRRSFERALSGVNPRLSRGQRRRRAALIIALIDGLGQYARSGGRLRTAIEGLEYDARKQIIAIANSP